jgi:hypothetical protein
MRIYLWSALRIVDLRTRGLRMSALRTMVLRMGGFEKETFLFLVIPLPTACKGEEISASKSPAIGGQVSMKPV